MCQWRMCTGSAACTSPETESAMQLHLTACLQQSWAGTRAPRQPNARLGLHASSGYNYRKCTLEIKTRDILSARWKTWKSTKKTDQLSPNSSNRSYCCINLTQEELVFCIQKRTVEILAHSLLRHGSIPENLPCLLTSALRRTRGFVLQVLQVCCCCCNNHNNNR